MCMIWLFVYPLVPLVAVGSHQHFHIASAVSEPLTIGSAKENQVGTSLSPSLSASQALSARRLLWLLNGKRIVVKERLNRMQCTGGVLWDCAIWLMVRYVHAFAQVDIRGGLGGGGKVVHESSSSFPCYCPDVYVRVCA